MHEIEEATAASRHDMPEVAVGGELVHVGIYMDHERLCAFAQRPVHRVALVEARAKHDETIEIAVEDGVGGMAAAGIADHAERQVMVLRKYAFGPQRGCDRNRPALGQHLQTSRGGIVLDASAGEKGDTGGLAIPKLSERCVR